MQGLYYRPVSFTSAACKVMEAIALVRLDWVARARGFLADEQTGFRWRRCTADSIADVVSMMEEAKSCGDAVLLVLIDINGAFDGLPHPVVQQALDLLGINGNLRRFILSFLEERTLRVRVGRSRSSPRPVAAGVPQGSVVSPFLFSQALARLPAAVPIDPNYPVSASIYADDIALWVRSPPHNHRRARSALQRALDTAAAYLSSIGLVISARKTEAMLLHPRAAARRTAPRLHLEGVQLPWSTAVTYLGLRIDHRLSWLPAVKTLHVQVLRVRKAVSQLLARGQGCTTGWALRLYNAAATSRLRYALPLVALTPARLKKLELQHRAAIRLCLGAPLSSQVAATLAEAATWPLSLLLLQQGLRHVDRLHHGPDGSALLSRLRSRPQSQMELPGVCKRRSPTCALQQTAASLLHEDHGGNLQIYVDGSEQPVTPVTIYCDSKAALLSLQRPERASLGVALLSTRLMALQEAGCSVSLHWLPAQVQILGNEEADALAKHAHHCVVPPSLAVTANNFTSHSLRRHLLACHPDKRMSLGRPPRPLPQRGLARRETSLLLRLRIGCCWTGACCHRHGLIASPACASCGEPETLEHLLLACPAYLQQRDRLLQEFRRLGLPSARQEDILFPATRPALIIWLLLDHRPLAFHQITTPTGPAGPFLPGCSVAAMATL
ncbi:uncharacterized protein LOC142558319 [Dermacentor variabilis]|uniref:uncharacterized protein LOC142558319 n=1 Tax=Dermacentor variabilis TaxID=34621 RepID=UPI003F5B8E83